MSAVNSLQPPEMPEQRANEPSMEEILASIRRIIADDQSMPGRIEAPVTEPNREPETDLAPAHPPQDVAPVHVLHPPHPDGAMPARDVDPSAGPSEQANKDHEQAVALASAMARGPISAPQYASPDGTNGGVARAAVPSSPGSDVDRGAEAGSDDRSEPEAPQVVDHDMRTTDDHAVAHELDETPESVISSTTQHSVVSAFNILAAARLVDNSEELRSLVREMLRPILVSWLDEHLPSLVERLVRDEIERVARGAH